MSLCLLSKYSYTYLECLIGESLHAAQEHAQINSLKYCMDSAKATEAIKTTLKMRLEMNKCEKKGAEMQGKSKRSASTPGSTASASVRSWGNLRDKLSERSKLAKKDPAPAKPNVALYQTILLSVLTKSSKLLFSVLKRLQSCKQLLTTVSLTRREISTLIWGTGSCGGNANLTKFQYACFK